MVAESRYFALLQIGQLAQGSHFWKKTSSLQVRNRLMVCNILITAVSLVNKYLYHFLFERPSMEYLSWRNDVNRVRNKLVCMYVCNKIFIIRKICSLQWSCFYTIFFNLFDCKIHHPFLVTVFAKRVYWRSLL